MRRERILAGLGDLRDLTGVEIGALDSPLLSKADGRVIYVDYTDTDSLKQRYASFDDHDADRIVNVDAIWGESTLAEATGLSGTADFVIASHVIEHVPDLVTWLQEIGSILVAGGTLHLAVPDRRYSFDIRRQESRLSEVIYAHMVRARKPLPHQILDFDLQFLAVDCAAAWDGSAEIPPVIDKTQLEHGIAVAREVMRTGEYLDIHCWVFTPLSFALLMRQLAALELVPFKCQHWSDTRENELEFIVIMGKGADAQENAESWRLMAAELGSAAAR
ncbi:MAG: methyltransferase type 12 [Sphingomonas bacterium]|jgi:SAM-dependent methyltransferase|nr:methyltransferase type 12 [Sphingomonas bacterium]MDB5685388.1 methyltransferase type 12 [Sphingomonas bacterium]